MAVIYETATTLNGFLATEDNSLDWLFEIPRGICMSARSTGAP